MKHFRSIIGTGKLTVFHECLLWKPTCAPFLVQHGHTAQLYKQSFVVFPWRHSKNTEPRSPNNSVNVEEKRFDWIYTRKGFEHFAARMEGRN